MSLLSRAFTDFQKLLGLDRFRLLKNFFLARRSWDDTLFRMRLYCIHNLGLLVFLALLNAAFFLRIDWDMDLLSHGRLRRLGGRTFFGMHCSMIDIYMFCHCMQCWSISSQYSESQSICEISRLAFEKSAWAYCQTVRLLVCECCAMVL